MTAGPSKKRQRVQHSACTSRHSSVIPTIDCSSLPDKSSTEVSKKPLNLYRNSSFSSIDAFNDASTADILLRLYLEVTPFDSSDSEFLASSDIQIYLHSHVLRRSKYFSALLSDRWQPQKDDDSSPLRLGFGVPAAHGSMDNHLAVLELLYVDDMTEAIDSAKTALDLLPVALKFLFEDCVKSCVRFLEAVPWTDEEEKRVMNLIPFLQEEESRELLSRVSPGRNDSCEEMLQGLILAAIHNYPNMAFVKAFVAKLLKDFSSKESAKRVLKRAFETSLKVVKESLEEYSSPNFRGDHNETEAIQRLNLHTAMTNAKHLSWLVERMIELRVADVAVVEWSEQASFTADLQRAFRDDAWRGIVPGFPSVLLRCTSKLANAVAAGTILATKQVRKKLVKHWLPVLLVSKDHSPLLSGNKNLCMELEETFLRIISTLPLSDAQELLQQCLSFTRNVDDCPHLFKAFNTWFRRAMHPPQPEKL
ncbi:BTB/POZ domain-containing protein At3g05675-like [Cucurbita moschata]|uniref:BTB/POZ domain-containing protein At3g05675-like n=1 Tax=Cucurbita moschata TaxID=3662 RepID=A0A6J1EZP1_CUCMO|nr:BTB/POZ domain-containing protein At3g05675-like [Cucurbita moschata]XP_022933657.1 BTB/POZ domain-containing protein At3g05675-like [Cucurbita moschata]